MGGPPPAGGGPRTAALRPGPGPPTSGPGLKALLVRESVHPGRDRSSWRILRGQASVLLGDIFRAKATFFGPDPPDVVVCIKYDLF